MIFLYQYKLRGSYYNNRCYAIIVDRDYHIVSPEEKWYNSRDTWLNLWSCLPATWSISLLGKEEQWHLPFVAANSLILVVILFLLKEVNLAVWAASFCTKLENWIFFGSWHFSSGITTCLMNVKNSHTLSLYKAHVFGRTVRQFYPNEGSLQGQCADSSNTRVLLVITLLVTAGVHKYQAPGRPNDCIIHYKIFLKRKTYVPLYWCILLKCSFVRIINLEQLYSLLS